MKSPQFQRQFSFGGPLTPAVRQLMIINAAVYLANLLVAGKPFSAGLNYQTALVEYLGLVPHRVVNDFAIWQTFSYLFIHLEFFHILFNMLALWWFGSDLEAAWGSKRFLRYYFFCGVGAGLVSTLFGLPTIGASGAVFGLLLWFGMTYPNRTLYIYFVIPVKAKYAVAAFGLLEIIALLSAGSNSRINHVAHLSGLAFGFLFLQLQGRSFRIGERWRDFRRKQKKKKFRVIRMDEMMDTEEDKEEPEDRPPTIH